MCSLDLARSWRKITKAFHKWSTCSAASCDTITITAILALFRVFAIWLAVDYFPKRFYGFLQATEVQPHCHSLQAKVHAVGGHEGQLLGPIRDITREELAVQEGSEVGQLLCGKGLVWLLRLYGWGRSTRPGRLSPREAHSQRRCC